MSVAISRFRAWIRQATVSWVPEDVGPVHVPAAVEAFVFAMVHTSKRPVTAGDLPYARVPPCSDALSARAVAAPLECRPVSGWPGDRRGRAITIGGAAP
jgi:hypothetical protein